MGIPDPSNGGQTPKGCPANAVLIRQRRSTYRATELPRGSLCCTVPGPFLGPDKKPVACVPWVQEFPFPLMVAKPFEEEASGPDGPVLALEVL